MQLLVKRSVMTGEAAKVYQSRVYSLERERKASGISATGSSSSMPGNSSQVPSPERQHQGSSRSPTGSSEEQSSVAMSHEEEFKTTAAVRGDRSSIGSNEQESSSHFGCVTNCIHSLTLTLTRVLVLLLS